MNRTARPSSRLRLWLFPVGLICLVVSPARGDGWTQWGLVPAATATSPRLATDGTNIYYSTLLEGVFRATLADRNFSLMPMTGFPLWDANTNTNGFGLWNLAVTPSGQLLVSGSPINVTSNNISPPPAPFNNTLPVFYYWDESGQQWHAAAVANKSYPYTTSAGDFTFAPDGAVWTCSGFASYAYRSTDDGHSYAAFDINALVPTNYLPFANGQTTFGKIFSILATPRNEIIVGTETGGFLHTTNNGQSWTSLDPNFTNTNSPNPLGRVGDAFVNGLDKYGNVLCKGIAFSAPYPSLSNWTGVTLIGYRPADGSYFDAAQGIPAGFTPPAVLTTPCGESFTYMNQNYLLTGGIFRSHDGSHWTQFNDNSPLNIPFAPGITNAMAQGNVITTLGNLVFIGAGGAQIWAYDATPPPVTNRPPSAVAQNVNLWKNAATSVTLTGNDADGDPLNFTVTVPPKSGALSGAPPDLTYTPSNNFTGLDSFYFVADDGKAVSAPVLINLAINAPTNTLSTITFTSPADGSVFIAPVDLTLTADASDSDGIRQVNFYSGASLVGIVTNTPYALALTNLPPGDYSFSARAIDHFNARTWASPVSVSVLPTAPILSIQSRADGNVMLSWPLALDDFFLESKTNLSDTWQFSPLAPTYSTNAQSITLPMAGQQFFRLMRPR